MKEEWSDLIDRLKSINDDAVAAYTPEVEAICNRKASQNEVELLLDYMLTFLIIAEVLKTNISMICIGK